MKYIKKFNENIHNRDPQIGDYVIVYADYFDSYILNFLKNNIGRIESIEHTLYDNDDLDDLSVLDDDYPYRVRFDEIIPISNRSYIDINREEIDKFSETKEDLEAMLNAKKYNL
jgi:hypothetical protein